MNSKISHTSDIIVTKGQGDRGRTRSTDVNVELSSDLDAYWKRQFRSLPEAQIQLRQMNSEMTTADKLIEVGRKCKLTLSRQGFLMSNWCEQKHSVLHKTIPGSRLVDWLQSTVRAVLTRSQASNIWQVLVDEELLDNGFGAQVTPKLNEESLEVQTFGQYAP
ncbi:uncharacterized protein LOC134184771 [Corticium candelabrum]|uniref:uncharacterized protein LOC134184771 n=1 Tax=Corticium candelabrum TaxID=121492 RepID=UPI002E349176|nr:uncharacterized protein LOC134184771 [Corticium candelabrum]